MYLNYYYICVTATKEEDDACPATFQSSRLYEIVASKECAMDHVPARRGIRLPKPSSRSATLYVPNSIVMRPSASQIDSYDDMPRRCSALAWLNPLMLSHSRACATTIANKDDTLRLDLATNSIWQNDQDRRRIGQTSRTTASNGPDNAANGSQVRGKRDSSKLS